MVLTSGEWREQVLSLTGGGVNVVFDPVGGDRFHESLRCLASEGRLVVVGFAGGDIPQIAVNRLLLRDVDVCGCKWSVLIGAPGGLAGAAERLGAMVDRGVVRPLVGARFALEDGARALSDMAERRTRGKAVLLVA